jgi:hypothetical protein
MLTLWEYTCKNTAEQKSKEKILIVYGEYIDDDKLTYKVYGG